jgi:4-hydroxy-tetrahydrodipicolinate synthase
VAIVTPFKANGAVDYTSLERLVEHIIKGGVNFIVVQGTTGEAATLTKEEKLAVLEFVIEVAKGRVPVVFGYGGNSTEAMIHGLSDFPLEKVDALLVASPYYNKPSQEGIYQHYKALVGATKTPIILYNVPGRTGSNMAAEITLRLARDFETIVAVKEASGDLNQMAQIIKHKPERFNVLSGDDDLVLPQMAIGAAGVISVIANAFPKRFSALTKAGKEGTITTAREYHYQFLDVIPMLFKEGNPGGIKALLSMLGIVENHLRLPLVPISKEVYDQLYRAPSDAGLTE